MPTYHGWTMFVSVFIYVSLEYCLSAVSLVNLVLVAERVIRLLARLLMLFAVVLLRLQLARSIYSAIASCTFALSE